MTRIVLSLVSHTNTGKTTLARTLLGRDIGEVRDAPHVTVSTDVHELIASDAGDQLCLADTPGFGDSLRLVRRLQGRAQPLGWLLSEVWDRWRDHPFWASQQALRHVQSQASVVLYLVNAAEPPTAAGYLAAEMALLAWVGKPVLVLLNQLGPPRAPAAEAADLQAWQAHLQAWPQVRDVLALDAFARCWVQELTLLAAVKRVLAGDDAAAMARLAAAWQARQQQVFDAAMATLAASLARIAAAREPLQDGAGWTDRLRRLGAALAQRDDAGAAAQAQRRLAAALDAEARASTAQLLELHGLQGSARGGSEGEIMARVARQFEHRAPLPEGRAAVVGGAVTGALAGLKADLLSGGLTMGGGLLAGGLLGALGAAGVARGINVVRGRTHSWVAWSDEALQAAAQAAVLRYLAVAHFGRGRGDWAHGEAPPHWAPQVAQALAAPPFAAAWPARAAADEGAPEVQALAAALRPALAAAVAGVLQRLYPAATSPAGAAATASDPASR